MTGTVRHPRDPSYDIEEFLGADLTADLTTCDREPIHLSEAIQPHGVLLALDRNDLRVRLASANTPRHFGVDASDLLGAPLGRAIGPGPVGRLQRVLADPRASGADPLVCHLPTGASYELTWHRIDGLVLVELEPAEVEGASPVATVFAEVRHATSTLQSASGVQGLCDAAVEEIKHLTGYDRVMVYRFHPDWHGEVVAEEHEAGQEPFLGLHYPASDIPRQARKLYLLNLLRVIADVDYEPVPLIGLPEGLGSPLNLSLSGLRSVSPIHLAYLRNMGVQATLTISLMHGTSLWGMVACHHSTPRRIGAQVRAACRLIGQVFSSQIVAQQGQEHQVYRARLAEIEAQLVARMAGAESLASALASPTPSVLALTAADGMVARIDGEVVTVGVVPPASAVDALLARLCADEEPVAVVLDDLPRRFDELAPFAEHASGVLGLPVSAAYEDFVLWFRGERVHSRRWAGDPGAPMLGDPDTPQSGHLNPRHSFEAWAQEVRGHSRPWLAAEIDAAHAFASALPELLFARARDRFAYLALHDSLTGLANRSLLLDRINQALFRQQRGGGNVAVLFIDLDHLKAVNDSLGHGAGDDLLRQAAQRIHGAIRTTDTAARIGGDEFVVLCEGVSQDAVGVLSERIVKDFQVPFLIENHETLVTVSIGVALATTDSTPAELLRNADTAMYRAKHSGRNATARFAEEPEPTTPGG